ncbi:hypothetical protein PM082_023108 [Marasmius tenuissimus]|nr:hypothetical protein PM082_023108 [Marasmius tenuissimus]
MCRWFFRVDRIKSVPTHRHNRKRGPLPNSRERSGLIGLKSGDSPRLLQQTTAATSTYLNDSLHQYSYKVHLSPTDGTEECGSLGVLNVDLNNLPEGMTANDVRKCADHPLGSKPRLNAQWESLAPMESNLSNRSNIIEDRAAQRCEYDAPYGCSGGYCWRTCGASGSGNWCWTAGGDGTFGTSMCRIPACESLAFQF